MTRLTGQCMYCRRIVTQDDTLSYWRSAEAGGIYCPRAPITPNGWHMHSAEPLEG